MLARENSGRASREAAEVHSGIDPIFSWATGIQAFGARFRLGKERDH
jgi:hypothetical protein